VSENDLSLTQRRKNASLDRARRRDDLCRTGWLHRSSTMVSEIRRSVQALPALKPGLLYPALFWLAVMALVAARLWIAP
jgi:hypothetical protein